MYSEKLENLIKGALADGVLEEREIKVLRRKAEEEGVDPDELQMDVEARLADMKAASASAKPKVEKMGTVKKCPQCGTVLTGMEAVCPGCGHMFTGVSSNSSVEKFLAGIQEIEKRVTSDSSDDMVDSNIRSVENYIKTYPIPNSAEDLREFVIILTSNAYGGGPSPYGIEYKTKLKECRKKVELMFPNDPTFIKLFKDVDAEEAKLTKNLYRILYGFIALFIVLIIGSICEHCSR